MNDICDHPLLHPRSLALETDPIDSLRDKVLTWLRTGATGALILGDSRAGKTTAIQTLKKDLIDRDGDLVPSLYQAIYPRDTKTVRSVILNLCQNVELQVSKQSADVLSLRLQEYLAEYVALANASKLALFIDEAQRLNPHQLSAFTEISDKLFLDKGIEVFTCFVANLGESALLIEQVTQEKHAHIYGRFFRNSHKFCGLQDVRELRRVLKQYDTLVYPLEGGPTYTEQFLPAEYAAGWRLAELAAPLWRVFRTIQKDLELSSWGMQWVIGTVNPLLTDLLPRFGVDTIDDELLEEAVRISGLTPDLGRR